MGSNCTNNTSKHEVDYNRAVPNDQNGPLLIFGQREAFSFSLRRPHACQVAKKSTCTLCFCNRRLLYSLRYSRRLDTHDHSSCRLGNDLTVHILRIRNNVGDVHYYQPYHILLCPSVEVCGICLRIPQGPRNSIMTCFFFFFLFSLEKPLEGLYVASLKQRSWLSVIGRRFAVDGSP